MTDERSFQAPAPLSDFLATAFGNVLVLFVLPPLGLLGLVCCYLAKRATAVGDVARAQHHLTSASAVARVSLYGSLVMALAGMALGVLPIVR